MQFKITQDFNPVGSDEKPQLHRIFNVAIGRLCYLLLHTTLSPAQLIAEVTSEINTYATGALGPLET